MPGHIFISHASKDDKFVKELREALEANKHSVWIDTLNLRGGAKLAPEINEAIEQAGQFIAVLSPNTINSPWVRKEIQKALEVERQRKDNGFHAIPLLLPGIEPSALENWFDEAPIGVKVELETGVVSEALPAILAALDKGAPEAPEAPEPLQTPLSNLVEELILKLSDPKVQASGGQPSATATAALVYQPADESHREVESRRFRFTAPLGLIEAPDWREDLRWRLKDYYRWPAGGFKARADGIEAQLLQWGKQLFDAAAQTESAKEVLRAWQNAANGAERRFSVMVDRDLPEGASQAEQTVAGEAASLLLSLPWELLHDGGEWLFQGRQSARVRRRFPNRIEQRPAAHDPPIRILLVSPRPEEESVGYIDHRLSALPLIEAVKNLGALAKLTMLSQPTFAALEGALKRAVETNRPFDVVHFDGHGVYDRQAGQAGLYFEDPKDKDKLEERAMQLVHAEKIATVMRDHNIPLTFLKVCQSAPTELDPTASVAVKLLEEGGASVVAMQPGAPVETAHRFFTAFYQELAYGACIGAAMLAGQRAIGGDSHRGKTPDAGDLHLQDWFVPTLYQEEQDQPLVTSLPPEQVRLLQARQRQLNLGELPDPPAHGFIGRSRELLKLERLLSRQPYAVVSGVGSAGKTTLAVELARWLGHTRCFRRAAFVRLEQSTDARSVLDSLGRQLLPEGENWSVAQYGNDLKRALQDVDRPLRNHPTLIVLDNCESVLPSENSTTGDTGKEKNDPEIPRDPRGSINEIFDLCSNLLDAHPATRIVFTSRNSLPEPFAQPANEVRLEGLNSEDAVALLSQVMKQEGLSPKADDSGDDNEELVQLVESVHCHAQAVTLLPREVARQGVRATTEDLRGLMAELDARRPGDPENPLYASAELSLRRLPPELRDPCRALGVFHGGAYLPVLGQVLGVDDETVRKLSRALVEVSLAEEMDYGHLRLDPALTNYLLGRMDADEQEAARDRWGAAMRTLTNYLEDQQLKDAQIAAGLTLLELPNLLAMLAWSKRRGTAKKAVALASQLEKLLDNLGRPQALAQASITREQAARGLADWSHDRFTTEAAGIDRLWELGQLPDALAAARQLLARCQAAGSDAFAEAAYDLAEAHIRLGRALGFVGEAEAALKELAEAQRRFETLAAAGDSGAERMAAVALTESGYYLRSLSRLDAAAVCYEEAIKRKEKLGDKRGMATSQFQFGAVRTLQQRYEDALELYAEAKAGFESLGERGAVAAAWRQIAAAHYRAEQFEQAERAYQQSLAIEAQQNNPAGEAATLNDLGILYGAMGRPDDAAPAYRQAADLYALLHDQVREGRARNNLAGAYIKLKRYDVARAELRRAIECGEPFGHAAQIWMTWSILHDLDLELATRHAAEAEEAREQAIHSYLAYRRDGGGSQSPLAHLYPLVAQAIRERQTSETEQRLAGLAAKASDPRAQAAIAALQAILRGDRDPALARNQELEFRDAAELKLLLETLGARSEIFE